MTLADRIQHLFDVGALTQCRYHHLLRIAWTIAGINGTDHLTLDGVTEAIQLGAEPIHW